MPRKDIERDWGQKFREVVKAANMGAFYISEDAEDALRDYINRPDIANEYPGAVLDEFGQSYDYAKECLNKLVICAKKDLRVVKY